MFFLFADRFNHSFIRFRLLNDLQSMADNIPIQQNETIRVAKKSITMSVIMVKPKEVTGLHITAVSTRQPSVNNLFQNYRDDKTKEQVVATAYLPGQLFFKANNNRNGLQRVTVFVFDNEKLFLNNISQSTSTEGKKFVSGKILAVSINGIKFNNLSKSEQVRTTFSSSISSSKKEADCVFWDFRGAGTLLFITTFSVFRKVSFCVLLHPSHTILKVN